MFQLLSKGGVVGGVAVEVFNLDNGFEVIEGLAARVRQADAVEVTRGKDKASAAHVEMCQTLDNDRNMMRVWLEARRQGMSPRERLIFCP